MSIPVTNSDQPLMNNDGQLIDNGMFFAYRFINNGTVINDLDDENLFWLVVFDNNVSGSFKNIGVIGFPSAGSLIQQACLINYGTFENDGVILGADPGSPGLEITNQSGGTLINNKDMVNVDSLTNDGMLTNNALGVLENQGTLINNSGAKIVNNGTIDTMKGTFPNYGTYTGTGKIIRSCSDHGTVKPGNSAGGMIVDGNYYKKGGS